MDVQFSNTASVTPASAAPHAEAPPAGPAAHGDDFHRLVLVLSMVVLLLAFLLQVRDDQRVAFSLLPAWPLPEVCQSRVLLGWDCPGCGLTRSFVHLAHADLPTSVAVHPLGWLVALFVAAQLPYRLWALRSPGGAPLGQRIPWAITASVLVLLVASWLARLVLG
jgi:hypothetical protein